MRRLVVPCSLMCALLGGCLKDNPAWSPGEAPGASTGDEESGAGELGSGGSGSTGESTGAPEPTGGAADSTEESGADEAGTMAIGLGCEQTEWVELELAFDSIADAGVVPGALGMPCAGWGAADEASCAALNFGATEFFRLVNEGGGRSAALLRFRADSIAAALADSGRSPADVVGARVAVVVWEPKPIASEASTLEVRLIAAQDAAWSEGSRDADEAKSGDSSALCRTIEDGECEAWSAGDAIAGSAPLGLLHVNAAAVAMNEEDDLTDQYHARLTSEPLAPALTLAIQQGESPGLVVALASARGMGDGQIGVKLRESPWSDPGLVLELCVR